MTAATRNQAGRKAQLAKEEPQQPPQDNEAEAGALACVLAANGDAPELLDRLNSDHFYDLRHRTAYLALCCLHKDGKQLDEIALHQYLKDNNQIEDAGGQGYVLALVDRTPSSANFPSFFETIEDRATRREARCVGEALIDSSNDTTKTASAIADAVRRVTEVYGRSSGQQLPKIVDAAAFVATPLPRPPELVRGILHKGSKLVLGGGSKSFKTWTLLDLAVSVAHGGPWLNFDTEQGRVLFVNFEIPDWSWRERIEAVATAKGLKLGKSRLSLLNLRGKAAGYALLLPYIRDAAKQDFSLIILDPIYKLYGGADENKAGDVAALLNAIEELASSTGAAVAFGAHFSKGNQAGKESIDRISGSGVFARDPDSLLVFTRHEEENAFTIEATMRNFAPVEPFAVRWQHPIMTPALDLDPAKLKQAGGRKPQHTLDDLLSVLTKSGLDNKEWKDAASEEHGISDRTFYRLRSELTAAGRILKSVNGKWLPVKK